MVVKEVYQIYLHSVASAVAPPSVIIPCLVEFIFQVLANVC